MKGWTETVATVIMAICAVGAFMWMLTRPASVSGAPTKISSDWDDVVQSGVVVFGDPVAADLVLVEFTDFECPFCAAFAEQVDSLRTEYPGAAFVVHHLPIDGHKYAYPSALAFECADQQDRAYEMYRALFAGQAEYGVKPWIEYAQAAAVPDLPAFEQCIAQPESAFPRITRGVLLAQENGVTGTPTVWANNSWVGPYMRMSTLRTKLDDLR